jgi:hypothetical protein
LSLCGLALVSCTSSGSTNGGTTDSSTPDGARDCRRGAVARAGCFKPSVAPAAWWPLDGDARDIAGCDDAAVVGTGGGYVTAMVGQGFSSQGQSSYLVAPDAAQLSSSHFTVMAWAKVDGISGLNKWIVAKGPQSGLNVDFTYSLAVVGTAPFSVSPKAVVNGPKEPGHLYMDFGDGTNEQVLLSDAALPLGAFVHVATTVDGANVQLYVNGQVAGTAAQKVNPKANAYPLMIGGVNYVPGAVDEIMVWNTALSGADIAAIFAAGAAGVCPQ